MIVTLGLQIAFLSSVVLVSHIMLQGAMDLKDADGVIVALFCRCYWMNYTRGASFIPCHFGLICTQR